MNSTLVNWLPENRGEIPLNLKLMRPIDGQLLETPFLGSRQMTRDPAQGIEGGGGRYVVTFGTGGPTGTDGGGAAKPRIWHDNLLYGELVAHTRAFPGVPP